MQHRCNGLIRSRAGLLAGCVAVGLAALGPVVGSASARARFAPPPRHPPAVKHATKARMAASATRVTASAASIRASAASYSGCWGTGPVVTDFRGYRYGTRYCHNYRSGQLDLYGGWSGYLYAGNNWFVCQSRFRSLPNPSVGSARNNIWLYTQGDVAYNHHGWGWFPATEVSGGVNYAPIPGLRWC